MKALGGASPVGSVTYVSPAYMAGQQVTDR